MSKKAKLPTEADKVRLMVLNNNLLISRRQNIVTSVDGGATIVTSAPVNLTVPVVTGTAVVGNVLSTTDGTWTNSPTSYTYQWKRDGVNIGSATNSTYLLVLADAGTTITVVVTATNASGSDNATSAGTAIASDASAPVITSMTVENATPNLITIQLTDASDLDTQVPVNAQWSISGAVNAPTITSQIVSASTKIIQLFLSANILDSDTPLVSYVNPGDGTGIKDVANNFLASSSNFAVTNNTGVLPVFSGKNNLGWWYTSTGVAGSVVEDRSGLNNDGGLVKSHLGTVTTATVLTCTTSLTGITVTSNAGTATLLIVGNTITVTGNGTAYNVLLSNGSIIPFAEGAGTQIATDFATTELVFNVTAGSIDWTATQDTYHYNHNLGFSHLGRMSAINQYITLTSGIAFSTTKFSFMITYSADNWGVGQDLAGTATTNTQFGFIVTAGAIGGTVRLGSGTTYVVTCADTAATVGIVNNTYAVFVFTRDALGNFTATVNGFSLLMNGAATVADAGATTISQWMRTSTSNSNVGILKEIEILDAADTALIGIKYNAENSFRGTLQGGFALVKYARPQGGDVAHRNTAGNWHNGAETRFKPNPSNNAAIIAAIAAWDNTKEITYANFFDASIVNPAFLNITNPIQVRNIVLWDSVLSYNEEIVANNFVGKTTININNITGWSTSNRLSYTAGSSYNANDSGFTVKIVVRPAFITTSQIIFGKTNAVSGNGWAVEAVANAAGSDITLRVKNGSNVTTRSRTTAFSEKEDDISIYHFVIRGNQMFTYRNGFKENTVTALTGITTTTDDMVIGAFSGGNAFGGGILACALYESTGMTDNEVEASYQLTKNNAYVQETGITLLFTGEDGNNNWVDKVSGAVTLTKSGTLTVNTINQAFNYRFRPEDYIDDAPLSPPLANTSAAIRIMLVGDSRWDPDPAGFSLTFAEALWNLIQADPDINNAQFNGFFVDVLTGVPGTPNYLHHSIAGATSSSMRSGGSGNLAAHTQLASPDGSPTIALVFLGTNATGTESNFNTEVDEYPIILNILKTYCPPGVRIGVMEELEHEDAIRRSRLQDLSYQHREVIWPRVEELGYTICKIQQWRYVTIQDGDFIDVVHQNAQGNAKKAERAFKLIKHLCGYTV